MFLFNFSHLLDEIDDGPGPLSGNGYYEEPEEQVQNFNRDHIPKIKSSSKPNLRSSLNRSGMKNVDRAMNDFGTDNSYQ